MGAHRVSPRRSGRLAVAVAILVASSALVLGAGRFPASSSPGGVSGSLGGSPAKLPSLAKGLAPSDGPAGADPSWSQLGESTHPPAQSGGAIANDPLDDYLVYFGTDGSTWTFSGAFGRGSWTELTPTPSPPATTFAAMTWDARDGYVLLLDGDQTWTFLGGAWTELYPSAAPSSRSQASMVFDYADDVVLLYGGWGGGSYGTSPLQDTWEYAAGVWTEVSSTSPPGPRDSYGLAFDPALGQVVLWGGNNVGTVTTTWAFAGGTWSEIDTPSSPPGRSGLTLTWDASTQSLIMFGGCSTSPGNCGTYYNDTWSFSGTAWTEFSTTQAPPPELGMAAANESDSAGGGIVLLATDGTTWTSEPTTYAVNVTASGLPGDTSWWLNLTNGPSFSSSGPHLQFVEPNGSYAYTAQSQDRALGTQGGTISVNGAPLAVELSFAQPTYSVTMSAPGLPSGTSWSVEVDGQNESTTTGSLSFLLPNGTFSYAASAEAGLVGPTSGNFTVDGSPLDVSVPYYPTLGPFASFGVTMNYTDPELVLPVVANETVVVLFAGSNDGGAPSTEISVDGVSEPFSTDQLISGEFGPNQALTGVYVLNVSTPGNVSFSVAAYAPGDHPQLLAAAVLNPGYWIAGLGSAVGAPSATLGLPDGGATYLYAGAGAGGGHLSTVGQLLGTTEPLGGDGQVDQTFLATSGDPNATVSNVLGVGNTVGISGVEVSAYPVVFEQSGLPPGTNWSVTVSPADEIRGGSDPTSPEVVLTSNNSTEQIDLPNGSYVYSPASSDPEVAASNGTFAVNGSGLAVPVEFRLPTYAVNLTATGLPSGANWSILFDGTSQLTTNGSVELRAPNGTYPYSALPVLYAGGAWYGTDAGNGTLVVAGASVDVTVPYARLAQVSVTFRESGLPSGRPWEVTLGSSGDNETTTTARSSLELLAPEAAVGLSLRAAGYSLSSVTGPGVVNSTRLNVTGPGVVRVTFGHLETLTFTERGLGPGVAWSVAIVSAAPGGPAGQTRTTTSSSATFTVVSDLYRWTVRPSTTEYEAKPTHGAVGVGVAPKAVKVAFKELTSKVTFEEMGLPRHTAWEVEIAGVGTYELTGASLTVRLPNGTYNYTVTSSNPKYSASSPTGTLTVATPTAVKVGETFTDPAGSEFPLVGASSLTSLRVEGRVT